MRVLIVGCGYVGLPLGGELVRQGHEVFGLRRSAAADAELEASGVKPLHADIRKPRALETLPCGFDWVVNCVASRGGDVEAYRELYLQGTCHLLEWLKASLPEKFVYTSSTGVYGQKDGSIVDEASPTLPGVETAQVLVETERVLLTAAREKSFPAVVLRVAGIYGPGRGYLLKQYLKGEARIEGTGGRYLNMIHREDLIGVIIAALERGKAGEIYNAVDDESVTQLNYFKWLAGQLGQELPAGAPENGGEGRKRGVTNKRVSNAKLKRELGFRFKFPTFREGYKDELERLGLSR